MPRAKSIKKLVRYYKCWVEDKNLYYKTKNDRYQVHKLTPDEFALWELGFADGHSCGMKHVKSAVSRISTELKRKTLESIYG